MFKLLKVILISFLLTCRVISCSPLEIHSKRKGDAQIVGIFPNSIYFDPSTKQCYQYNLLNIQLTQAFIYAVDELVNNNPNLLPGLKLGWQIIDSCSSAQHATTLLTTVIASSELQKFSQYSCSRSSGLAQSQNNLINSSAMELNNFSTYTSPIIGVVGDYFDYITTLLASYTSSLRYAHISYFSFNPTLDNRRLFPYFFRTSSSGVMLGQVVYDIIKKFKWNWISIIYAVSKSVNYDFQQLGSFLLHNNVCVAYQNRINEDSAIDDMANVITAIKNQPRSKVVLIFGREDIVYRFFKQAETQNLTGITWIGTYGWILSTRIRKLNPSVIGGTVGISIARNSLNNFTSYLKHLDLCNNLQNPWFIQAVREKLIGLGIMNNENITNCSINSRLKDHLLANFYNFDDTSIFVTDAILALAYALHHQLGCNQTFCPPIDQFNFNRYRPSYKQFLHHVKFKISSQEYFQFQSNGASTHNFDIVNYQSITDSSGSKVISVKIGTWNQHSNLKIDIERIVWNTGKAWHQVPLARCSDDCQPGSYFTSNPNLTVKYQRCCWLCKTCQPQTISSKVNSLKCIQCVNFTKANRNQSDCIDLEVVGIQFDTPYAIIYYIFTAIFILLLIFVWIVMILYRHSPIVKGSNFILINVLLTFISFTLLTIALEFIPINQEICNIRAFVVILVPSGHLLTVVSKTIQIWLIFRNQINPKPWISKLMSTRNLMIFIIISMLIFSSLLLILVLYKRVSVLQVETIDGRLDSRCVFIISPIIVTIVVLICILCISCFVLAFRVRKLPDNYNEARYIFIATAMLCFESVCSIPIYWASTGESRRVLGIVILLLQSYTTLLSYFLPKIYIIFLQPDRNKRQYAVESVANYSMNQYQKSSLATKAKYESEINQTIS